MSIPNGAQKILRQRLSAGDAIDRQDDIGIYDKRRALIMREYDLVVQLLDQEHARREQYTNAEHAMKLKLDVVDSQESDARDRKQANDDRARSEAERNVGLLNAETVYDRKRVYAQSEYDRSIAAIEKTGGTEEERARALAALQKQLGDIDLQEKNTYAAAELKQQTENLRTKHSIELMGAGNVFDYRRKLAQAEYDNIVQQLKKEGQATEQNLGAARVALETKNTLINRDESERRARNEIAAIGHIGAALESMFKMIGDKEMAKFVNDFREALVMVKEIIALTQLASGGISPLSFFGFADGGYTGGGSVSDIAGVVHKGEIVFESPIVQSNRDDLLALRSHLQTGGNLADLVRRQGQFDNSVAGGAGLDIGPLIGELRELRGDVQGMKIQQPIILQHVFDTQQFFRDNMPTYEQYSASKHL